MSNVRATSPHPTKKDHHELDETKAAEGKLLLGTV